MTDDSSDVVPVRRFWSDLGLPGLFDVHVHFLPPNIQRRVYEQFDAAWLRDVCWENGARLLGAHRRIS